MSVALHDRIRQRLVDLKKSARQASLDSGLSQEAVSKILRSPEHSQTLVTIEKLAKGLDTTPSWLAYGDQHDNSKPFVSGPDHIVINADLLRQVLIFVLRNESISEERAATLADILPGALSGPPVDAVQKDPFLSFQVHFQLEEMRSGHRSNQ